MRDLDERNIGYPLQELVKALDRADSILNRITNGTPSDSPLRKRLNALPRLEAYDELQFTLSNELSAFADELAAEIIAEDYGPQPDQAKSEAA